MDFNQIGGLDHYVRALKEMVFLPLLYPDLFERFKVQPPRGVLFYGPPGTGAHGQARPGVCCSTPRGVLFYGPPGTGAHGRARVCAHAAQRRVWNVAEWCSLMACLAQVRLGACTSAHKCAHACVLVCMYVCGLSWCAQVRGNSACRVRGLKVFLMSAEGGGSARLLRPASSTRPALAVLLLCPWRAHSVPCAAPQCARAHVLLRAALCESCTLSSACLSVTPRPALALPWALARFHLRRIARMCLVAPLLHAHSVACHKHTRAAVLHLGAGAGKTLVARALAAQASQGAGQQVSFFMRKGADVLSKWWVGRGGGSGAPRRGKLR